MSTSTQCPICQQVFLSDVIAQHASTCGQQQQMTPQPDTQQPPPAYAPTATQGYATQASVPQQQPYAQYATPQNSPQQYAPQQHAPPFQQQHSFPQPMYQQHRPGLMPMQSMPMQPVPMQPIPVQPMMYAPQLMQQNTINAYGYNAQQSPVTNINQSAVLNDGRIVARDAQSGLAVEGALRVSPQDQKNYELLNMQRAENELLRLQRERDAANVRVDQEKRLEIEIDYDEKELTILRKKRKWWRIGCVVGWIFVLPMLIFSGTCSARRYEIGNQIRTLKERLKGMKKQLHMIKAQSLYVQQVQTTSPMSINSAPQTGGAVAATKLTVPLSSV